MRIRSTHGRSCPYLGFVTDEWVRGSVALRPSRPTSLRRPRARAGAYCLDSTAGCAHVAEPRDKSATKAPKLSKERQVLSEGYSILYEDARKFDASDLVLLVKAESDAMKKLVTSVGEIGDELTKGLERSTKPS